MAALALLGRVLELRAGLRRTEDVALRVLAATAAWSWAALANMLLVRGRFARWFDPGDAKNPSG